MHCTYCAHAARHGWWGTEAVSHCRGCHNTWPRRSRRQHCTGCHETFSSPGAADRHWTRRGHIHPSRVRSLVQARDGTWKGRGQRPAHAPQMTGGDYAGADEPVGAGSRDAGGAS